MTAEEVIKKLQPIFSDIFLDEVTVTPELCAADVEEWDSLCQISLTVDIEKEFDIKFDLGELETAQNTGDMVEMIINHINAK